MEAPRATLPTARDPEDGPAVRISVVVPAFNEARCLPRLLRSLAVAARRYRHGPGAVEAIVADNGSSDRTGLIARTHGCSVVDVRPRAIGAVRNAGAAAARGEVLAFVDADMRLHPETLNAIEDHLARGRVGGISGALPERWSPGIAAGWGVLGLLTALAGYGVPRALHQLMPSGVLCCRRRDWAQIGGYDESRLFAEDVRFLLDLQDLGRRRRQRCGWLDGAPAICSTRKFDTHGDWHYVALPARMAFWALFDRSGIRRWAERYWYGPQREH